MQYVCQGRLDIRKFKGELCLLQGLGYHSLPIEQQLIRHFPYQHSHGYRRHRQIYQCTSVTKHGVTKSTTGDRLWRSDVKRA